MATELELSKKKPSAQMRMADVNPILGSQAVLQDGIQGVRNAVGGGNFASAAGKAINTTAMLPGAALGDAGMAVGRAGSALYGAVAPRVEDFGRGLMGLPDRQAAAAPVAPAAQAAPVAMPVPKPALPAAQPAPNAGGVMSGVILNGRQVQPAQPMQQAPAQQLAQVTPQQDAVRAEMMRKAYAPTDYSAGRFGAVQPQRQEVVMPTLDPKKGFAEGLNDFVNQAAAAGGAIRANKAVRADERMGMEKTAEANRTGVTLRGQDINAAQSGQANSIARERLSMEKVDSERRGEGAVLENASKKQLLDAQTEYLGAAGAGRGEALEKLQALTGRTPKETPNRYTVVPRGADESGRNLGSDVLDNATGKLVDIRPGQQTSNAPLPNHVAALKKNPKLAAAFDQQYGAGAAAKLLGTK